MIVLENNDVKVVINSTGAELSSFLDKSDHTEYIWQGNPAIWGYHAPNLFPIVGGLKDDSLLVNGNTYPLKRHGFARTSIFRKIEAAPHQAIFELKYDDETLKMYPFKFEFQVIYHLRGRKLEIIYKVINLDEGTIYFSVGAHPAFNVPLSPNEKFEDYYLHFEIDEQLQSHQLSDKGLFNGETIPYELDGKKLKLTKELFKKDALVFKNLKSRSITLENSSNRKSVKVEFPHFNYLGIWSKDDAPFVCIEPWLGCADSEGELIDISQKEAIQKLEHGHVFETAFCISI